MPRLDRIAAAEVIRSVRPQTKLVLHTGSLHEEPRPRAAEAGLPLLDKTQFAQVLAELLAHEPAGEDELPLREIESLVVTALQKTRGDGVVVARPDGSVAFYKARAAAALARPYPARELDLERLRAHHQPYSLDGRPLPPEQRPIARAR